MDDLMIWYEYMSPFGSRRLVLEGECLFVAVLCVGRNFDAGDGGTYIYQPTLTLEMLDINKLRLCHKVWCKTGSCPDCRSVAKKVQIFFCFKSVCHCCQFSPSRNNGVKAKTQVP